MGTGATVDDPRESAPSRPEASMELVPVPSVALVGPLAEVPLEDEVPPPSAWWVPAVIVAVVVVVGVVAAMALADRPAPSRALAGTAVTSPTVAPTTEAPTTAAPTTEAPTTEAPTTAPTTAAPSTTVASGTGRPTEVLADGWVRYTAADGSFVVELPARPETSTERVATAAGVVERTERLSVRDGLTVGIGSLARPTGGQDVDAFLRDVAAAAATQLGGRAELGSSGVSGPGRYLDFRVTYDGGAVLHARAVWAAGRLHMVTTTGTGDGAAATQERVSRSFVPS